MNRQINMKRTRRAGRQLMSVALLFLFGMSGSGIAPTLMALAAQWDGRHSVTLIQRSNSARLVLSHADESGHHTAASTEVHEASTVSTLITFLSPVREADGDHVIQISRTTLRAGATSIRIPDSPLPNITFPVAISSAIPLERRTQPSLRSSLLDRSPKRRSVILLI